ncbi:hypothetical protein LIN78_08350 [Leeia sp. TBRC 13508]|uniref:VWFA domain-containing protein n=1 Tax=Leeia speluncae TaxID=2884804 RepID=A0ABS8D5R6_9NEIS|nr:PilC/PilY family type IV pilus protein [Leeia speluncae]MCB6183556.1 hypothetical protein [Leeia speluncae]
MRSQKSKMLGVHRQKQISLVVASSILYLSGMHAMAASPYPAVPQYSAVTVPPNIMLLIDDSGSMQDCPSGSGCYNSSGVNKSKNSPYENKMRIAVTVSNDLIAANPSMKWGLFTFQNTSGLMRAPVKVRDTNASLTEIQNIITPLVPSYGTPLATTFNEITRYFRGQSSLYSRDTDPLTGGTQTTYTSPIQYRCQKNFVIILTDGAPNDRNSFPTENSTNTTRLPYRDNNAYPAGSNYNTTALAYLAKFAHDVDLIQGGTDSDGVSYDATDFPKQTISTYMVGFAAPGSANAVFTQTTAWGGGQYFAATNKAALISSLNTIVQSISNQVANSRQVIASTTTVDASTKMIKGIYDTSDWHGDVLIAPYNGGNPDWGNAISAMTVMRNTAAANSTWYDSRVVLTGLVTGTTTVTTTPLAFTKAALPTYAAYWNLLGSTTTDKQNVVDFIRGKQGISGYRTRLNNASQDQLLGDFLDTNPVNVGVPSGSSNLADYTTFKTANASRGMVFAGANDGMLHGFNTSNGAEVVGYVPSSVYGNLPDLTSTSYSGSAHKYYVDGPLIATDIKVQRAGETSASWKTVLVGALAQGGKGVYALDVTNTSNFTQATPSKAVMWEYTNKHDASIGYNFSKALITVARTSSSTAEPVAIIPSGYDNNTTDSPNDTISDSTSTNKLYVIRLRDGALIRSISVPVTGAGLSAPAGVDIGQDGIVDYIYSGDLNGNLWRFKLTDNNPANWNVSSTPIFTAKNASNQNQPIFYRPVISTAKDGAGNKLGTVIVFGTGRLLTTADRTNTNVQSLYGVLDRYDSSSDSFTSNNLTRSNLIQQTVNTTNQKNVTDSNKLQGTYRNISQNAVDLTNVGTYGWYIDLPDSGSRLAANPRLEEASDGSLSAVWFPTGQPVSSGQCTAGGEGWLYSVNSLTGSPLQTSFLDIDQDGYAGVGDNLDFNSDGQVTADARDSASGYKLNFYPAEMSRIGLSTTTVSNGVSASTGNFGDQGSTVALKDSNESGVFTQMSGGGGDGGNTVTVAQTPVNGTTTLGSASSTTTLTFTNNCLGTSCSSNTASKVRVNRVTWRELL